MKPKFRTHWDPIDEQGEDYTGKVSITEPGRSESLQHLVERLTHKPNATSKDVTMYALQTGQNFEDPTTLSDEELDQRFDATVVKGDNMDAAEALANAIADLASAQSVAGATTSAEQATLKERATIEENAPAEQVPGGRQAANENASD